MLEMPLNVKRFERNIYVEWKKTTTTHVGNRCSSTAARASMDVWVCVNEPTESYMIGFASGKMLKRSLLYTVPIATSFSRPEPFSQ